MIEVDVTTLENTSGGSNKFYRVYRLQARHTHLAQYGSQNNGRFGGQFAIINSITEAVDRVYKKKREGYTEVDRITMDVPDAIGDMFTDGTSKGDLGAELESEYRRALQRQPASSTPTPSPAPTPDPTPASTLPVDDRLADLSQRFLDAIAQASNDPGQGLVTLAVLKGQLGELQQEFSKLAAYRETLEMMTEGGL